ncbi:MAG: GNAT family N-acetyltransferase [Tannerellaceae bacterium]|jgi:ribosomal protein S18 acetylase RimI-like enzyme|nr:GNAT family N-acetyltransferase [Tannerellaceae bacterium]
MKNNPTIIPCNFADPDHRSAVVSLINQYIADDMGGGDPLDETKAQRLLSGLESRPATILLLAKAGCEYAGMLTAFDNFSTFTARPMINIHDVFVDSRFRGYGIGRLLMESIIAEGRRRNCRRITLEVRVDNHSAQNLYRSLGFSEVPPGMYYWRLYLED